MRTLAVAKIGSMSALAALWLAFIVFHAVREWRTSPRALAHGLFNGGSITKAEAAASSFDIIGGDDDRYFWFAQITDIHISKHGVGNGESNLNMFLASVVPMTRPLFVAVTGDIVDGKNPRLAASPQHEAEWKTYNDLLKKHGVLERPDFWFDLRGNHDCFDVDGWHSPRNYFAKYSAMKSSAYSRTFEMPFGKYGIIAIDGCPEYGPTRPLNFFGTLSQSSMDLLQRQLAENSESGVRQNILLGHYPTVTMQFSKCSDGTSFSHLSSKITAYLSGHLHRLFGGIGDHMYALQPEGFAEFELDDLKDNAVYRVAAFDHDVFAFVDVPLTKKTVILPTNPIDSRTVIPAHANPSAITSSTHIRAMIFSNAPVVSCRAFCGTSEYVLRPVSHTGERPLWIGEWDPKIYAGGIAHTMRIRATRADGIVETITYKFRTDGFPSKVGSFAEIILKSDLQTAVRVIFWTLYALALLLFVIPALYAAKLCHTGRFGQWRARQLLKLDCDDQEPAPTHSSRVLAKFDRACRLPERAFFSAQLGTVGVARRWTTSLPVIAHIIWLPILPLFVGKLEPSSNAYSAVFIWGIWRQHTGWVYRFDSWLFATMSLALMSIPSLILFVFATSSERSDGFRTDRGIVSRVFSMLGICLATLVGAAGWLAAAAFQMLTIRSYGWTAAATGVAFVYPLLGMVMYPLLRLIPRKMLGRMLSGRASLRSRLASSSGSKSLSKTSMGESQKYASTRSARAK